MRRAFRRASRTAIRRSSLGPWWYVLLFKRGRHQHARKPQHDPPVLPRKPSARDEHAETHAAQIPSVARTLAQAWSTGFALGLTNAELRLAARVKSGDTSAELPLAWARTLAEVLHIGRRKDRGRRRSRDHDHDHDQRENGETSLHYKTSNPAAPHAFTRAPRATSAPSPAARKQYKGNNQSRGAFFEHGAEAEQVAESARAVSEQTAPKFERRFIEDLRDTLVVMRVAPSTKAAEKLLVEAVDDGVLTPGMDMREALRAIRAHASQ